MIVPMKKVSLIVLDRERKSALTELRRIGVVHPIEKTAQSIDFTALSERKSKTAGAINILREIAAADLKNKKASAQKPSAEDAAALVDRAHDLLAEKRSADELRLRLQAELARLAPWGSVDPASFAELAASGIDVVPYELSVKNYATLDPSVRVIVVSRAKASVRCLVFRENGTLPAALPSDALPIVLPDLSTPEMERSVAEKTDRIEKIDVELSLIAGRLDAIEAYAEKIGSALEFERVRLSMELLTEQDEAHAIVQLDGFVPADEIAAVIAAAKKHGWAVFADDPTGDDAVPTKVKNSALVRIIQPIFDFLGTVPGYREYDISVWFLLFFTFFFAMIFGDGGYGSLLLLSALVLAAKAKFAGKAIPDMVYLLMLLGGATVFWGALTLSWFGIAPDKLPAFFSAVDLYWLSNANPDSGDNVKVFCFMLGTVQLAIAHFKNVRRDFGSLKFLAQIGQGAMLVGMLSLVLNLVIDAERFPLPTYAPYLIAIGFILNFVFANYGGGNFFAAVGKSVLASMANIVSVFLGVVNVFADIVSYIRLWAVGLAGLAISQTINNMVGPLLGKFSLFAIGIIVLVFGHGLNMLLSVLSVIVHGVRLNVLEFSSHLGMEWSGFSYDPFRERIDTEETSSKEQL